MRALGLVLLAGCGAGAPHAAGSAFCGSCHVEQHAGWSASGHARSTTSPVFQALLPKVEQAWGASAKARCVACHAPGHADEARITCVSCHAAVGNRGEKNGALVVDVEQPLSSRAKSFTNAAHEVAPRGLLTNASLCGTCHEVHGPGLFDERTLTEFRATGGDDSCLSCHEAAGHRFAGVDPAWEESAEVRAQADALARALWRKGLELSVVEGESDVVITVKNVTRHAVPTGVAMLRDVWVDVEVDGERHEVMNLRAKTLRDGLEVPLITDAKEVVSGALEAGATRSVTVARPTRVVLRARAVRADVLEALAVDGAAVTTHDLSVVDLPRRR
ncbi:MAG: hypothetical protein JNM69_39520 [Archangium sp.]|nr:hypothetical protein [Archangium sp.]